MAEGRVYDVTLALGDPPPSGRTARVHAVSLDVTTPPVHQQGLVHSIALSVGPGVVTQGAIWVRLNGGWVRHRAYVRVNGEWR